MIIIKKARNGQYYFIVKARNGRVLVTSETYTRKSNCNTGISALQIVMEGDIKVKDLTGE